MIQPTFHLKSQKISDNTAEIIIEPLPKNFGHTVGNALRRVLLGSLSGAAAVRVNITGVNHQFSTLSGLKEDVLDFVLNLKQINFILETDDSATVKLDVKGKKDVTAADIELPAGVRIANSDLVLAHLSSSSARLKAVIEVSKGVGYVPLEQHATQEIGVIPLDASFSPVVKANYKIEATRVGQKTDLDKLILTVTTNGTIEPEDAVIASAKILTSFFKHVYDPQFAPEESPELISNVIDDQPVEDLDLPVRVINSLKKGGFKSISSLQETNLEDLTKVKNIGAKSAKQILIKVKARYES